MGIKPFMSTALLHIDLINIVYLTVLLSLSGQHNIALYDVEPTIKIPFE